MPEVRKTLVMGTVKHSVGKPTRVTLLFTFVESRDRVHASQAIGTTHSQNTLSAPRALRSVMAESRIDNLALDCRTFPYRCPSLSAPCGSDVIV